MIDVFRSLDIQYIAAVPGSTFKGLHESVVNYGMTTQPNINFITCMHEEASVAFSHGYAKVSGKPMACMVHGTVGLQHASMAIYNAWADRAPVLVIAGAHLDAEKRDGFVDWIHSVNDGPALVREFIKWDDTPASLGHFAESTVRAYKFAMTPPYGPVVLAIDEELQDNPSGEAFPPIPKLSPVAPPRGSDAAVVEAAKMLVAAENPVIVADRVARTPEGLANMIALAEALQAPVIDNRGRMNFPWRHPLNHSSRGRATLGSADCVLGLELTDYMGTSRAAPRAAKRISINASDLYMKSTYQNFERYTPVDLAMAADSETTLPALTEAVKMLIDSNKRSAFAARGAKLAEAHQAQLKASREAAAIGWDIQPMTTARMCMELYEQIRGEDWAMLSDTDFQTMWPQQLWDCDQHYRYIGGSGAYGVGYTAPASMGAAYAHKEHGRLAVAIGGDGDLMFSPGVLWTAAHEQIPLLYIVHNNRAWHQEVMWIERMAAERERGIDRAHIGTTISDPHINYAMLAKSMGVYSEGPVTNPGDLGAALKRAIAVVKKGEPALVDVVAQGR
jgi:thiamine pyrophosphate-dependent acetolactate synthase large subunit-like protein